MEIYLVFALAIVGQILLFTSGRRLDFVIKDWNSCAYRDLNKFLRKILLLKHIHIRDNFLKLGIIYQIVAYLLLIIITLVFCDFLIGRLIIGFRVANDLVFVIIMLVAITVPFIGIILELIIYLIRKLKRRKKYE